MNYQFEGLKGVLEIILRNLGSTMENFENMKL